jgi:hypothetical protein
VSAAGRRGEARGSWRRLPRRPRSRCRCDNQARPLPRVLLRTRTALCANSRVVYARDQQRAPLRVTRDVVVVVVEEWWSNAAPALWSKTSMWT